MSDIFSSSINDDITENDTISTAVTFHGAPRDRLDTITQVAGVGVQMLFSVENTENEEKSSAAIQSKSTNITATEETFDLIFKTTHNSQEPDIRLILSPGSNGTNNDNKLILVNPYASNADDERKSKLQFQGLQA
jgi:hypothetical protein